MAFTLRPTPAGRVNGHAKQCIDNTIYIVKFKIEIDIALDGDDKLNQKILLHASEDHSLDHDIVSTF